MATWGVHRPPFRVLRRAIGAEYTVEFAGGREAEVFAESLSIRPRASPYQRAPPQPITTARVEGGCVHFPRAVGRALFGGEFRPPALRESSPLGPLAFPPLPHQHDVISQLVHHFRGSEKPELGYMRGSEAVLQAGCGDGKTFVFLAVAAQLGGPVMVCVHTSRLVEQWVAAVRKTLPEARVGVLKAAKKPKPTDNFVVASIQTLVARAEPHVFDGYSLVGIDEAHHVPAETFAAVVSTIPCARLALSATPKGRADGLESLLFWLCGNMYHMQGPRVVADVRVYKYAPTTRQAGTPITTRTRRKLSREPARNVLIGDIVRREAESGHCVLVLTDFIDHARELADALPGSGIMCGKLQRDTDARVLFASYAFSSEGVDLQRVSCLVMAMPCHHNVEQVLGRIRTAVGPRLPPLVIDIRDMPLFSRFKYARLDAFYAERNWRVLADDN
jgi:superfamily II DNA or RNA helicase